MTIMLTLAQCFYKSRSTKSSTMGYLLLKKDDLKAFKSFLNGKEIEVGVRIGSNANIFSPDEEVDIFYDNDDSDSYRARITRQKRCAEIPGGHALLTLGLVRQ